MKKTSLLVLVLALSACLASGVMFGCSSDSSDTQSAEDTANLTPLERIIQTNTVENLAGPDGTLSCTMETYGEDSSLEDTLAIEWKMTGGKPSLIWKDTYDDATQLSMSEYSGDNCGAIYSVEDSDKYATVYPQNDFSESIFDEWNSLIDYEGTQSDVVTTENGEAILEVREDQGEDADNYFTAKYVFNPDTYVLTSLEVLVYTTESSEVIERIVVKDIATGTDFQLDQNPYQMIAEADDANSCNLTVIVTPLEGDQITSTYKVARDTDVDLAIAEEFDMYSDEGMTTLIDEIDVSGESATVYVKLKEDATTDDGSDGSLDIGASDAPGTEYTSEDGAVLTLGADGKLYDEAGNAVDLDADEDISGE